MLPGESHSIPELATTFVNALPDAQARAEDLALCGLLLSVAAKWAASLHDNAHGRSAAQKCLFVPSHTLDRFVNATQEEAKHRFLEWAHAFSIEFSRTHPVSAARRAAVIIRERRDGRDDAVTLADLIGVSPRQLRREFRQTFGITLAKYVRQTRLRRALEVMRLRPGKIEPVALEVGYKSKKNFYRFFKQSTGMTPSAFLRLPSDAARHVIESTQQA
jgi:AraC-like DNA-binding protein